MSLCSTGCGQKAGKAAQHRWHGEVRQKSGIFAIATSSALILEREQLLCQCPKPDLRKGTVKYTTNPKPLPSLHAHNPQQQDRGLEDSES